MGGGRQGVRLRSPSGSGPPHYPSAPGSGDRGCCGPPKPPPLTQLVVCPVFFARLTPVRALRPIPPHPTPSHRPGSFLVRQDPDDLQKGKTRYILSACHGTRVSHTLIDELVL